METPHGLTALEAAAFHFSDKASISLADLETVVGKKPCYMTKPVKSITT